MKKGLFLCLVFLFSLFSLSCSSEDDTQGKTVYRHSSQTYSANSQNDSSAEYVAWTAGNLYRQMVNGNLDFEEGYARLTELACGSSQKQMASSNVKKEFIKQLSETRDTFHSQGDSVQDMVFSEPVSSNSGSGSVSIFRIQVNQSGKKYYFQQDLIREADGWKIAGDNLVNDFIIR